MEACVTIRMKSLRMLRLENRFKTVNGMEACVTGIKCPLWWVIGKGGFKTVNGMEACVTTKPKITDKAISINKFQNRKRYGGMRDYSRYGYKR